ncbi:MAG TPA: FGGY-family carbohydrate kinase [Acidimicrobiales bacterium]|nr:FGGY-family carbohydrate kinase [Acidimicrobiales bacterium]
MTRVAAVDLGATSARVAVVELDGPDPLDVEVVHRYPHAPVRDGGGNLRWEWDRLVAEVERGLQRAQASGPLDSIGIDTWGVDYGLLDAGGTLVAPPFSYRDARTEGWGDVVGRIGAERLYETTGIQLMAINTLFQLAAHDRAELDRAARIVMLPELLVHALTGRVHGERTSAGTSALVDLATGTWEPGLLDAVGVDAALLPPIAAAGTPAGEWNGVPVHLVGGHDTASAVAALPDPAPGAAFVATGTWFLVGAERERPDVSDAARRANFSNEPGVAGGVRFLKNVMGFWLLERCRDAWGSPPVKGLVAAAMAGPPAPTFDATDNRFLSPSSMEAEIRDAAGLGAAAPRSVVVRSIVDSMVTATAHVLDELADLRRSPVTELHLLGGGARLPELVGALSSACGVPVVAGPVEATAVGNAMVQGVALDVFPDLSAARRAIVRQPQGAST